MSKTIATTIKGVEYIISTNLYDYITELEQEIKITDKNYQDK